jgi:hypothetical protein
VRQVELLDPVELFLRQIGRVRWAPQQHECVRVELYRSPF